MNLQLRHSIAWQMIVPIPLTVIALSLAATLGQWLLERAALLTPMMATANAFLGAAVLIAAGLFQWTPVKDACLRHCQTPVDFIIQHGGSAMMLLARSLSASGTGAIASDAAGQSWRCSSSAG